MLRRFDLTLRAREQHPLCIAHAVPAGSVWARSQRQWWQAVQLSPQLAGLRADTHVTVLAVARVLHDHADWTTRVSRPTHAEIARAAGCSTRTVRRVRALLEGAGLIGIVTAGRTRDLVDPDAGALAQAYVLSIPAELLDQPHDASPDGQDQQDAATAGDDAGEAPQPGPAAGQPPVDNPVDEHGHPSRPPVLGSGEGPPHARTRATCARSARGEANKIENRSGREDVGREIIFPAVQVPAGRTERQLAAAEARRIDPVLRRISTLHVAAVCREWHLAGWTIADVRAALVRRPDGSPWPHSLVAADVRHVPGWIRHRLAAWRTDPADLASPPAASPSQRTAAARAAATAAHAQLRAEQLATAAAAVAAADVVPGWTRARAEQAARAAAVAAAVHAARRAAPILPADLTDPDPAPAAPAPAVARPSSRSTGRPIRPVGETTDPQIAAMRAAVRARRRPRA